MYFLVIFQLFSGGPGDRIFRRTGEPGTATGHTAFVKLRAKRKKKRSSAKLSVGENKSGRNNVNGRGNACAIEDVRGNGLSAREE